VSQGLSPVAARRSGRPKVLPRAAAQGRAAAAQDGVCDVGDLCLYFLPANKGFGSAYDNTHNDPNLNNNRFISSGLGAGVTVGNNASAYWNRDPSTTARVCTGVNYTGCTDLPRNTAGTLPGGFGDDVESVYWSGPTN
jgi:Peptidase inhibitor family I36